MVEMAHSSNVIINGGIFNSAQGDFHINNKDSDSGLRDLKLAVSLGAMHDSAERYPPPNCHPDTRKAVRQIILDWIHRESLGSIFFWLYGPAGAGKTAILQAIAEFLCSPSGSGQNFGGSFFFSRGKKGRDQGHFLFSTIAYQLALKVPGLRQHVNRIMELDPTLHTKSMDVQLQTLVVDAFKILSPPPQRSYLVILDGLDECHDKAIQQSILRLLSEMITVHKLPLRFLIGSRPESHIRDGFDQESLYTITRRVVLDDTFDPGRDIQVFLRDGFAKICNKNPILSHVEQPWPGEGIIDLLVQRSSGQFIYAATVLKFVGADFCSPTKQLALVLMPDPTAFSDLDQLYSQILSVYPSAVNIVQILGIIIASDGQTLTPEVIEDILGMEEGEAELVLRGLSSLMKDGNNENGECLNKEVIISFAHASFRDYLLDSSRSGPFYVNQQEYENQFAIRSFALIIESIRSWGVSSITRVIHTTTWDYFTSNLPDHFRRSPKVVKEAIITGINDLMQEFWSISSDEAVGAVEASFFAMRRLFEILQNLFATVVMLECDPSNWEMYCGDSDQWELDDDGSTTKFMVLCDRYRKVFEQSISKSKDLGEMIKFLPGVLVQKYMSMQGMADLYRVKPDFLECLTKSTFEPLKHRHHNGYAPNSRCYKLNSYLSDFLHCDPVLQHISICRHFLSLLDGSNAFDLQSYPELSNYACNYFFDHLCGATMDLLSAQNIPNDHPAILHDLETSTAYYVDKNSSGYIVAQHIIKAILRWADKLGGIRLKADLKDRVGHLTGKIYREMLCITRQVCRAGDGSRHLDGVLVEVDDDESVMCITMCGLDCGLNHVEVGAFSWTQQYRIILSRNLLGNMSEGDGIPSSFSTFITTPELSGPSGFYINPSIYHTQITEYLLEKIHLRPNFFYDGTFTKHLCRALPTEIIFYLLRSTPSYLLICDSGEQFYILGIIVQWLQGLGSDRPSDLYDRFRHELLQFREPRKSKIWEGTSGTVHWPSLEH